MRIHIVNQYVRLPWQDGGTRHFLIARELVRRGHDVTLVASPVNYASGRPEQGVSPGLAEYDGVKVLWLETPPYRSHSVSRIWNMLVFAARVMYSQAAAKLPVPDVVIGSSPHLFAAVAARRRAAAAAVPFLFEVRDLWPLSLQEISGFSDRHPLIRIFRRAESSCYRHAARTITLLPNAAAYMEAHGADRGSVRWIPNGVELQPLPEDAGGEREGRFIVTYTGTHARANALETILQAAGLLQERGYGDDILFRFVGRGSEKGRLQKMAQQRAPGMVEFLDPVPKQEVLSVLAGTDACIATLKAIPLYRHGISLNKLFDYLAAARPVILAGDSPRNPVELSGGGIVVPPGDPAAIAEAVLRLKAMPEAERREMGRAGRRYVERNHSIPVLADRFEQVLKEVAG
ncbi:MAG TPA: glycosyltransferase WbuB [Sedimenticola thiotaurini]|uniref:Glycosyltransferase WbuB n=1 Tax=Sedimenticola thiotaurini TaxID=1543721 RepID=A0A831RLS1_9GAMM|nr:glycosyltransferase WbuB [Sedimenticola thiotaurini]